MRPFAEKVRDAREKCGFSQTELAEKIGISKRSVIAYESGEKEPRHSTLMKLAKALGVSTKFLSDAECENPAEDIERDYYLDEAQSMYGAAGARDMDKLLEANAALFAGGDLSQEEKDRFFQSIMEAYVACKQEATAVYGKKK